MPTMNLSAYITDQDIALFIEHKVRIKEVVKSVIEKELKKIKGEVQNGSAVN